MTFKNGDRVVFGLGSTQNPTAATAACRGLATVCGIRPNDSYPLWIIKLDDKEELGSVWDCIIVPGSMIRKLSPLEELAMAAVDA